MKKPLSLLLALILAICAFTGFALVPTTSVTNADPFTLDAIKVSDLSGYNAPYAALDNPNTFVENQTAYVVLSFTLKGSATSLAPIATGDTRTTTVTSPTLNFTYAPSTTRVQMIGDDGTIYPVGTSSATSFAVAADSSNGLIVTYTHPSVSPAAPDKSARFFVSFMAITKPGIIGTVTAGKLTDSKGFNASGILHIYVNGAMKYSVTRTPAVVDDSSTFATSYKISNASGQELMTYNFDPTSHAFTGITYLGFPAAWTYNGKLIATDVTPDPDMTYDLTALGNELNTFFGFNWAYNNYVPGKYFTAKASGNPVIVTDSYAYIASVTPKPTTTPKPTKSPSPDDGVIIVPTGDQPSNVAFVLLGFAAVAGGLLFFLSKKVKG